MSTPRFVTSSIDPRRLTMLDHQRLAQTHGERRRIHGPILPMEQEPPSWSTIGVAVALAVAVIAFLWIVIPGAAWLTLEIGAKL